MSPPAGTARPDPGSVPWLAAAVAAAALVLLPLAALAIAAGSPSPTHWSHLATNVLPAAVADTVLLLAGVGLLAGTLGIGAAWLVTAFEFPGRRTLTWALLLPLAVPTYIVAFAYLDLLHPVGPVQSALRDVLGIASPRDLRLPDVRSMPGCILLLGFVLYPYVYLPVRAVFLMQSASLFEAARTLGVGPAGLLARVALPMARPAAAVGMTLALLETLNDIGASEFLGVRTLTVAVYTTWITRSDLAGAAQLALAMLVVVVAIVFLERRARRGRRFTSDARLHRPVAPRRLTGGRAALATACGALPVLVGFAAPAAYLVDASVARVRFAGLSDTLLREAGTTVLLAAAATVAVVGLGLMVVAASRLTGRRLARAALAVASSGYAVPGTVLALGVLPVITAIDAAVDRAATAWLGVSTGLLLLGSGAGIVYAYIARFLALGTGTVSAGFSQIPLALDDASRTLGAGRLARLRRIHLPLLWPAILTAALLVFVDCLKELPATLLLRPIGVETLATHLYGEAVRGTYEDAAIAALLIVLTGLGPVVLLARLGETGALARHTAGTGATHDVGTARPN